MHEMGIACDIYRTCREAVREHGPGRIDRVRVRVGELTGVEPELVAFAWQAVTAGGPDAGSSLDVEWRPADQRCPACGEVKARPEATWLRLCPDCGRPLEVRGGTELEVVDLTFVTDDGDPAAGEENGR